MKHKFLITGSHGQIGMGLIPKLLKKYGKESLIATDVKDSTTLKDCNYLQLDVRDKQKFENIVKNENINYIVHLAGIISVLAEKNPQLAKEVNVDSVFTSLDLAAKYNTKIFIPSTILTFAGEKINVKHVSQKTVPEPRFLYGICKVFMENMGIYYSQKHGIDFRCIRYPVVVSPFEYAYNGTGFYATEIFFKAVREKYYSINMNKDRTMPFCHLDDVIDATMQILDVNQNKLTRKIYNLMGLSFSPEDLVNEITKNIKEFKVDYEPKVNDNIAARCPHTIEDISSRTDFGFQPKYNNLEILVKDMINIAKSTKI